MHGNGRRPAGAAPLLLILALLLFLTAVAAAGSGYSARVVVIARKRSGAAHGRVVVEDYAGMMAALMGQRLEDVVAPELAAGLVIEAGQGGGGSTGYRALEPNKQVCPRDEGCAGKKDGEAYTRPCTYKNQCERSP